jgi:hypothetical protein
MKRKRLIILLLVLSLCFQASIFAETIIFKSGQRLEEKIIKKTDEYIQVEYDGIFYW